MKARSLFQDITQALLFCDAYVSDSIFKCYRNSNAIESQLLSQTQVESNLKGPLE